MKLRNYTKNSIRSFRMLRSLLDDYPKMTLEDIGKKHGVSTQRMQQVLATAREADLMPLKHEPGLPGVDIVFLREYRNREAARKIVFEHKTYREPSDDLGWALSVLAEPLSTDSPFVVDDGIAASMLGELPTVIKA